MSMRVQGALLLSGLVLSCGASRNEPPSQPAAAPPPPPATAVAPAVPPPRDDGRLPEVAEPSEYRVHLNVDPTKKTFSGEVTIQVRLAAPTRVIVLHGRKLRIHEAAVTSQGRTQPAKTDSRAAAGSKGDADELVVTIADAVSGEASLALAYDADFSEGLAGLYRVDEGGKAYAFTQFEPFGARLAFPCFDEPSAKVPFEVSLTVPPGLQAVSNMPVRTEAPEPGGKGVTFSFEKSPPLPTYLVALAVGPLEVRAGARQPVPLRLLAVPPRAAMGQVALDAARDHLKVLEEYFGSKYPYPKLDLVAVPNFGAGAMENAGLVTFREERLLVDEKTTPTALRRTAYLVIAHELAHMWFGDLVTMEWWDDIWLNEGFATWMASKVVDAWRPELGARVEAYSGTSMAMHVDTLDSARRVRQKASSTTEILEAFDGITYQKGAALLDMVERWLGPDTFRAGIVRYLEEHRFGNAGSEDLFAALATASGKPVPEVLRSFTEQTGVPAVELSACRADAGAATVTLRQSEYRPLGSAQRARKSWTFPVCVHYADRNPGHGGAQACVLARDTETALLIPGGTCPAWIHPNADQSGYYRAALPRESLEQLASLPRDKLTPRERVGLLSDAWALVRAGALDVPAFFALARRFQGDPEPAVWERIVSSLNFLDAEMIPPASAERFSAEVRKLLAPEVRSLGLEPRPKDGDHDRMRRRLLLTAMGGIGRDPQVLARAGKLASAWLDDPRSVQGDLAASALQLAARQGDVVLFDRIVKRLKEGGTPEDRVLAVSALGEFREPSLVRRALELLVDGTVRTQDQLYVLRGLFSRRETRSVAFQAVVERMDTFLGRIPPFARRRVVPVLAEACGEEERERARAVLEPRLASLEGADRGFSQALEEASRCGAFREHHAPSIERWLSVATKK